MKFYAYCTLAIVRMAILPIISEAMVLASSSCLSLSFSRGTTTKFPNNNNNNNKTYFPKSVPLVHLEFTVKSGPPSLTVRFQNSKHDRKDEFRESRKIYDEFGQVLKPFLRRRVTSSYSGGHDYGFRKYWRLPGQVGTIIADSGRHTTSISLVAEPKTIQEWKNLTAVQQEMIDKLNEKVIECKEKYPTLHLELTTPPGRHRGLCEIVYEIKETGKPSIQNGIPQIDPARERKEAWEEAKRKMKTFYARSKYAIQKMRGKNLECKGVITFSKSIDDSDKEFSPQALLQKAANEALYNAKPRIKAGFGSSTAKLCRDTVHVFAYFSPVNPTDNKRTRAIVTRAIREEAEKYPSWFQPITIPVPLPQNGGGIS